MRPKQRAMVVGTTVALIVVGGAVVLAVPRGKPEASADRPASVATAPVEKKTISETLSQTGILTYRARPDGSPYTVVNQSRGTYTSLPTPGQVIRPGHVLYRVDESPVVLLRGSVPAYRSLSIGASGTDVAQLSTDLVKLGYATRAQLTPGSADFGSATAAAVEKLQAAVGLPRTGTLALGEVVFEPDAVRVTNVPVQPGSGAQPGQTVLAGTSTTQQVQVQLDASQQSNMAVGDKVSITLPNSTTTVGVVSSVAKVASCPSTTGSGDSDSSGTGGCSSGSSPSVTVGITPSQAGATGRWDQAPVQVGITTSSVRDALVVPVTALVARSDGSYAVEVVTRTGSSHLVPVSLGVFDDADGLVQVTSSGLAVGQTVVVAST